MAIRGTSPSVASFDWLGFWLSFTILKNSWNAQKNTKVKAVCTNRKMREKVYVMEICTYVC